MEVWGIVEQDHRRLAGVMDQMERDGATNAAVAGLKVDLNACLAAEEAAIYSQLRSRPGFAKRIAEVSKADELMRRLCDDMEQTSPTAREGLIRQVKTALHHHMHEDSCMFPVAMRELQYHVWEHMKHEYESTKRTAVRSSKGEPSLPPELELREAVQSLQPSSSEGGRATAPALLDKIRRIEYGHVLACQAAIDRAEKSSHRALLGEIAEDHLLAAELLGDFDSDAMVKRGAKLMPARVGWLRVVCSATMGEAALLRAVATNERLSWHAYTQMLGQSEGPPSGHTLFGILTRKTKEHTHVLSTALSK